MTEMGRDGLKPDYIFCPVGEGELATKLMLSLATLGSDIRVVGVTIPQNVYATGKEFSADIGPSVADKLVCPYSDFRELLTRLCAERGHEIITVSDDQLREEMRYLQKLDIRAEPSAAVAFAGANAYSSRFSMDDNVVIVNTGDGSQNFAPPKKIRRRYVAVAVLLAAGIGLTIAAPRMREAYAMHKIRQESKESWRQRQIELLESDPVYNEIYAYALLRGEMREIDQQVFNDLHNYFGAHDNIVMMMYNQGGHLRDNVNDFNRWLEHQKHAKEEEVKKVKAFWEKYAEDQKKKLR